MTDLSYDPIYFDLSCFFIIKRIKGFVHFHWCKGRLFSGKVELTFGMKK